MPTASQIDLTHRVGTRSGRDCAGGDKFAELGADALPGRAVDVPWVAGCVAWLECRVLPEPDAANKHDLFIAEVLAAWADEDVFKYLFSKYFHGSWEVVRSKTCICIS